MDGALGHLAHQYILTRIRRREIAPSTGRDQWSALTVLIEAHGNRPVGRLGEHTIERWLDARRNLQPGSLVTQWHICACFIDSLVGQGLVRRNPMRSMRPPKRPKVQPITLVDDELDRLLAVAPDTRARAIVHLEWGLGARRIEVHRARIETWNRRSKLIVLTGKRGAQRTVPVPKATAVALEDYLAEWPATTGPLIRPFTGPPRPLSLSALTRLVTEWMYQAEVKRAGWDGKSGHALRRTRASELMDYTRDLRLVQDLLGHESLSSTAHYLQRPDLEELRAGMEGSASLGRTRADLAA